MLALIVLAVASIYLARMCYLLGHFCEWYDERVATLDRIVAGPHDSIGAVQALLRFTASLEDYRRPPLIPGIPRQRKEGV